MGRIWRPLATGHRPDLTAARRCYSMGERCDDHISLTQKSIPPGSSLFFPFLGPDSLPHLPSLFGDGRPTGYPTSSKRYDNAVIVRDSRLVHLLAAISSDSVLRHVDRSTTCSRPSVFLNHSIYPLTRWLDLASILIPTTTAVYPARFYPALSPLRLTAHCAAAGTPHRYVRVDISRF